MTSPLISGTAATPRYEAVSPIPRFEPPSLQLAAITTSTTPALRLRSGHGSSSGKRYDLSSSGPTSNAAPATSPAADLCEAPTLFTSPARWQLAAPTSSSPSGTSGSTPASEGSALP